MSTSWIVGLDDPAAADAALVGGKGAGLRRLVALDARVPTGFVVSTTAFAAAMEGAEDLEASLRDVGPDTPVDVLEQAAGRAREALLAASRSGPVLEAVREAYTRLVGPDTRVAVRSSAVGEDAAGASFAGEHDTYLWVCGIDDVLARIRGCWASLYTDRAIAYRLQMGYDHDDIDMAVAVQKMVRPRAATAMSMSSWS